MSQQKAYYIAFFNLKLFLLKNISAHKTIPDYWAKLNSRLDDLFKNDPKIVTVPKNSNFDNIAFLRAKTKNYNLDIARNNVNLRFSSDGDEKYETYKEEFKKYFKKLFLYLESEKIYSSAVGLALGFFIPHGKATELLSNLLSKNPKSLHRDKKIYTINLSFVTESKFNSITIHNRSETTEVLSPKKTKGLLLWRQIHTEQSNKKESRLKIDTDKLYDFFDSKLELDNLLTALYGEGK